MTTRNATTLPRVPSALKIDLERNGLTFDDRASTRLASAHDASHFLLTPLAVVRPKSIQELAAVMAVARRRQIPVTFRSGGTSLSGQAGTNGLLVDTRRHFRSIDVGRGGERVRCGPGATVRAVNARLAHHGYKLGPDPASEIACTIGGVVANNSSGMACGISQNTYQTLASAVLVLPSGTVVDTSRRDADDRLREEEPEIYEGLLRLRDRIRGDFSSVEKLTSLHSIKNTMGYGLNSFIDHEDPVKILEHVVVGSEGTLAFVAEATFRTVPVRPHLATALLIFNDLADATRALPSLVEGGFATIELLDSVSLKVAQRDPEATEDLLSLAVKDHAALLVEHQTSTVDELQGRVARGQELFSTLPLVGPSPMSSDPTRRAALWHIRKGLYALVAGARPSGTTALLEDIAVPVQNLYRTCSELTKLFDKHGYQDSVIFGHAKDGNIHFMLNERFDDPAQLVRYERFTEDMVDLVLAQKGTLKAEHGTGRMMAPYVRRQYGAELHDVMLELKRLIDPDLLLNPGVLLTNDNNAHTNDLKVAPTVEPEVDRCVECGYCEPACPSKDLTMTPRQRIALRRELQLARSAGDEELVADLKADYQYNGLETCAVDGMCQTACPVLINTGDLVRRLRAEQNGNGRQPVGTAMSRHWSGFTRAASAGLTVSNRLPRGLPQAASKLGRAVLGAETIPLYTSDLPPGGPRRATVHHPAPVAVYFSSCTTSMFGTTDGSAVSESFMRLCHRANVAIATPADLPSLCCGTPWKSKGLERGGDLMRARVLDHLRAATNDWAIPVVVDAASCTEGLLTLLGSTDARVMDAVSFAARHLLPALPTKRRYRSLTLHPTCSSTRLGINDDLKSLAEAVADEVFEPDDWGCCAFAGDRGMLHPELTESATQREAAEVRDGTSDAHASLNRTCEIGMTRATGYEYQHILQLLDYAT